MAALTYQPQSLSWRGGELIEMRTVWSGQAPFTCTLVLDGQRYACYGGKAAGGNACNPVGPVLRCGSPKLADGTQGDATLEVADATGRVLQQLPMRVAAPFYPTTTYLIRALCPEVWACGPSDLGEEAIA